MYRIKKVKYISLIISTLYLFSCNPQTKYDVLHYVFDGVPNPEVEDSLALVDSLKLIASTNPEIMAFNLESKTMNFHPPYQEKQCDMCHSMSSFGKLAQEQPDLCYNCHVSFSDKYDFVHGPVEGGFCSACHDPHKSEEENLLINKGQDICFKCHEKELIIEKETHEGIEETFCTECHNPHGGEDRFIFR